MSQLGVSLPIIFYGKGAGCSAIPTIREERGRSSTDDVALVGDDQEEGTFEETSEDTPEALALACIEAGFVRTLQAGDDFKTKPKAYRSGASLESREYRRDSETSPWEIIYKYKNSEAIRYVDRVFMAKFPGTERWEVALQVQSSALGNREYDACVFATLNGQQLVTLVNAVPYEDDSVVEGAPSEGKESCTSDANESEEEADFGSGSVVTSDEEVMINGRLLGEPSAAESCLVPNSSNESDEGPSETLSQAKRRRVEAAQYQIDRGQQKIAETMTLQVQRDLTQTNMPTLRVCLKKRTSTSLKQWCFRCLHSKPAFSRNLSLPWTLMPPPGGIPGKQQQHHPHESVRRPQPRGNGNLRQKLNFSVNAPWHARIALSAA